MRKRFSLVLFSTLVICILFAVPTIGYDRFRPNKLDDLNGHTVGVQTGCTYEDYLLERCPDANIKFYSDANTMIMAVEQGKLECYVTEKCTFKVEQKYHPAIVPLKEVLANIQSGLVFGKTERHKKIYYEMEEFIASCNKDGTFDELANYWLENYDSETCVVDRSGITGEKGILNVAIESGYEPVSYMSNGEYSGYDIDFMYRFSRKYGYDPKFLPLSFDAIAPAVVSGKADMGPAVLSDERLEGNLFSSPYFSNDIIVAYFDEDLVASKDFFSSILSSIEKTFIKEDRWKLFCEGAFVTLLITVSSIIIGTILGYILYMICKEGNAVINKITDILGWLFHGIPSVLLLMILCYIVFAKSSLGNIVVSIIGFSLLFCFSTFDMITSGVKAVGIGQYEAARAQGFTTQQTFILIQNPQAIFHYLPTYKNEVIALLKETSIVGYIAVQDLTKMSDIVRSRTYEAFFPLIVTAIIYFLLIIIIMWGIKKIDPIVDITKKDARKALKDINLSC